MYCDSISNWDNSNIFTLCATSSGSNVNVTLTQWTPSYIEAYNSNWTMRLYRWVNGGWKLGGTRTGYVSKISPSNRTFTDVLRGRIKVEVSMDSPLFFNTIHVIIPSH